MSKPYIRTTRKKPRPGRLKGDDLAELRRRCFERDGWRCHHRTSDVGICGIPVEDDLPDWHPRKAHMAHVRNKGMWGDSIDNVTTRCKHHHIDVEHAYGPSGVKPCPKK